MEFKPALAMIYRQKQSSAVLEDPLLLYGALSDACGNELQAKKSIELFFAIDKKLHLFQSVINSNGNVEPLLARYGLVSDLVSAGAFRKLADIVGQIVQCGGECFYPESAVPKTPAGGGATPARSKPAPQKNAPKPTPSPQAPAQVHKAPTPPSPPATPLTSPSVPSSTGGGNLGLILGILIPFVLVIIGVVCLAVFGKKIQWWQWQHIIGGVIGLLGLVAYFFVLFIIDDELTYKVTPLAFLLLAAVMFCLASAKPSSCRIMFYYFEGYFILGALFAALMAFSDDEGGLTLANIGVALVSIVEIVVVHFPHEWWQWQHVVGAFGGLILGVIVAVIIYVVSEVLVAWEWYKLATVVCGVFFVCSTVLAFVLGANYTTIFYWLQGWLIAGMAWSAWGAFDDIEPVWGIADGVELLLSIGVIVLVRFFA